MAKTPNASPVARQRESVESARRKRVEVCLANPPLFGDYYLAPYDPVWRNAGPLPHVAREVIAFATRVRRGVVMMPPEFLKTTALGVITTWLTCRYAAADNLALLTGGLLSEEQDLAERNLSVPAWHIENNALIRADFIDVTGKPLLEPDPEEDKWTDKEIVVRREGKIKDPTWMAKGINAKGIQGARWRHCFGDDIITPANANSPTRQAETERLWDEQITTRVLTQGQAVIFGNFNNSRDALSRISRRTSYATLRRPSLHMPGDRAQPPKDPTDAKAVEQLPEKWPRARLELERAEKPNRFRRIHLLDDKADVGERLKLEWLQQISDDDTPVNTARWLMAIDPAPGGDSNDLDFFNITIGALHGSADDAHLDIAISHDARISIGDQVELIAAYHDRFDRFGQGVHAIGISKIALDRYFGGALAIFRPDLRRKLKEVSIGQASKPERLESLGPYAATGWLRIWDTAATALTSDPVDQPQELSFVEQWVGFHPQGGSDTGIAHDDKLDGADVLQRTAELFGYSPGPRKVVLKVAGTRG